MPPYPNNEYAPVDLMWILICGAMVFLMQGGFCCLESGFVRAKNSINVAAKNLLDFCLAGSIFWAIGYGLMFGTSYAGWFGTNGFLVKETSPWELAVFLFQMMFCGTAVTIIAGAVAERTRLFGYLWIVVITTLLIYPVIGHWAWKQGDSPGWLAGRGFVDFAGSMVVHSVAGWVALAAVLVIGPRLGRFDHRERPPQGHNIPLATLGGLLLWFGWFGFNGGSSMSISEQVPAILVNTTLAAAMGGIAAALLTWMTNNKIDVPMLINGILSGLVAITASCQAVTPSSAVVIGLVAGVLCVCLVALLNRLRIDDAVGAIPVHLGGGVWGTVAVALFGDPQILGTELSRLEQLGVQAQGILASGVWSFGSAFLLLWLTHKFVSLRVDTEDERRGLNMAEHDATTEILELLFEMNRHRVTGDFSSRVSVDPHTEVGQIAAQYNQVLEAFSEQSTQTRQHAENAEAARELAESARSELAKKIDTLDQFHQLTVGREERMVELKREINEMCQRLGELPRYPIANNATT